MLPVRAQPVGQNTPCRTGTNDDIIAAASISHLGHRGGVPTTP